MMNVTYFFQLRDYIIYILFFREGNYLNNNFLNSKNIDLEAWTFDVYKRLTWPNHSISPAYESTSID